MRVGEEVPSGLVSFVSRLQSEAVTGPVGGALCLRGAARCEVGPPPPRWGRGSVWHVPPPQGSGDGGGGRGRDAGREGGRGDGEGDGGGGHGGSSSKTSLALPAS